MNPSPFLYSGGRSSNKRSRVDERRMLIDMGYFEEEELGKSRVGSNRVSEKGRLRNEGVVDELDEVEFG